MSRRGQPGLFPATALGRQAAEKSRAEGWMDDSGAICPRGLSHLIQEVPPRQVLEDFVRAVEARENQLTDLATQVCTLLANLEAMRGHLSQVLSTLYAPRKEYAATLVQAIQGWKGAEDMPLPELYQQVGAVQSVGVFHDVLRELAVAGQIRLQPWTGPLYEMPQPELALLIGHEIGYYVSLAGKE
jgi:hypothetical protein